MNAFRWICVLCFGLLAASAAAKDAVFATPEQTHPLNILAAPPAEGSEQQKQELAELHKIESERTAAQAAQAGFDDEHEDFFLFQSVLGEKFAAENLPLTAAFGKEISADESGNAAAAKGFFHRAHPYTVDATLKPVCKTKTKPDSYPSGHTLVGWLLGLALVEMIPEKREEILARAEDYGHNRLVCGVHFPSDVQASKLLGYAAHAVEMQNPQFRAELAAAKAEVRARLGLAESK